MATKHTTKLIRQESPNLIPERDLGAIPVLQAEHLGIDFGGLTAVNDFNIALGPTEISGIIGPNGAGKTTVFNLLTNVYKPTRGSVMIDGYDLAGKSVVEANHMGIARTFQNIRLFSNLSVLDNVKAGLHNHHSYSTFEGIFRLPRYRAQEKEMNRRAEELLSVFHLEQMAEVKAKNLPYGSQRKLEIARALATEPKLLLLDEPAAGMNPQETKELMEMIRWVKKEFGITILLIEHDMSLVMGICERIYVLEYGAIIANGSPEDIRTNPEVIRAYLGAEE